MARLFLLRFLRLLNQNPIMSLLSLGLSWCEEFFDDVVFAGFVDAIVLALVPRRVFHVRA